MRVLEYLVGVFWGLFRSHGYGVAEERIGHFCNNVNAKSVESLENLTAAIATTHNILKAHQEVMPTWQYPKRRRAGGGEG